MIISNSYISILMLLFLSACIDDFTPELDQYNQYLVVDGKITNKEGPVTITLSKSSPAGQASFNPLPACTVEISDDLGNVWELPESEDGVYSTSGDELTGIPGRSYSISITTPEGKDYRSDFEELIAPVAIDSVYNEIEYREEPGYKHDLAGYRFFVDSEIAEQGQYYFLWELESTYEYHSDYTIRWIYDGELDWFYNPDSLYYCWITNRVNNIFTANTKPLTISKVNHLPLHFISTETRALSVRYSLLVKQYSISVQAYDFWNNVRINMEEGGSLYTSLPFQITGNVKNVNNPAEPVLGYFLVAGLDEKRIFVDRPHYSVPQYYDECELSEADFERYGQMAMMDPVTWPIYAIETMGGRRAVPEKICVDCRERGGAIIKPDFWID
ncbi:MAG: DUF4249 domain-containing protein [Bacteroidales bacterium]|nr:DUF4249 domain-containing protein [Bacteroidales bacterium]